MQVAAMFWLLLLSPVSADVINNRVQACIRLNRMYDDNTAAFVSFADAKDYLIEKRLAAKDAAAAKEYLAEQRKFENFVDEALERLHMIPRVKTNLGCP